MGKRFFYAEKPYILFDLHCQIVKKVVILKYLFCSLTAAELISIRKLCGCLRLKKKGVECDAKTSGS